jgi:type II secretory pathway component PulF
MEDIIEEYTRYTYITFGVSIFLFVIIGIIALVLLIRKIKKNKVKEQKLVDDLRLVASINCGFCNAKIDSDSVYCKYCGKKL